MILVDYCVLLVMSVHVIPVIGITTGTDENPMWQCSKYHFEERLLEKLLKVEHKMEIFTDKMKQWESEFNSGVKTLKDSTTNVDDFVHTLSDTFEKHKKNLTKHYC